MIQWNNTITLFFIVFSLLKMANVHRLGDYDNNRRAGGYQSLPADDGIGNFVASNKVPFIYTPSNDTPPLQYSIPLTIKLTFCPALKLYSFMNVMAIVMVAMFIVECIQGIDMTTGVLQIQAGVLVNLGGNVPTLVQQGYVWRLITAAFLHANLGHILSNLVSGYIIITRLEACYNTLYMIAIFVISAICGNILSDLAATKPYQVSVGGSTGIYGYIGCLLAYLVVNWSELARMGPLRANLACMVAMIIILSLLFSFTQSSNAIDYYGHLGGFVGGTFGSMLILPTISVEGNKLMRAIGGGILGIYLLVIFLVFYLDKSW